MKHEELHFTTSDGIDIFYQVWRPEGTVKGIVQIVHGLAEHAGRYTHVVNKLVPEGYVVYGDDHRGHGRSGGIPGFINNFNEFIDDQKEMTKIIRQKEGGIPLFVLGHSMGSVISILYVADYPSEFSGVILSGAGTGIGEGVNWFTLLLVRVLSKVLPKMTVKNELSDGVSRDPAVKEAYNNDPYVLHKFTARLGNELFKAFNSVSEKIGDISIPVLFQTGEKDPLVIHADKLFSFVKAKDSTLKIYDELFHEVYNELEEDRNRVLSDLNEWLDNHL